MSMQMACPKLRRLPEATVELAFCRSVSKKTGKYMSTKVSKQAAKQAGRQSGKQMQATVQSDSFPVNPSFQLPGPLLSSPFTQPTRARTHSLSLCLCPRPFLHGQAAPLGAGFEFQPGNVMAAYGAGPGIERP